jgi:hypothetical protein
LRREDQKQWRSSPKGDELSKEEQPQPGDYVWTTDPATGRKRPAIVIDSIQDEYKHPERYATIKDGSRLFGRPKMPRVDLQDPTVSASAPQQQFGAMLSGFTIAVVSAPDEETARLWLENSMKIHGNFGKLQAWIEAGSRVALVAARDESERW